MYWLLCVLWCAANVVFWGWWLQPARVGDPFAYVAFTLAWAYEFTLLPSAYLYFLGRMRQPIESPAPSHLKVALVTLCVPSQETLSVIASQLKCLVAVTYPHDSWILDEGGSDDIRRLAKRLGVRYFSRCNVARYNQPHAPFAARTKAGNVNAWLDAHGRAYDVFVQFDIDHQPRADYLDRVLGYFDDPKVAWVQAPSVYANLTHWVARGAAEQELVLQGPLQRGFFGFSQTPFIIGSHCTYRTAAVLEIGGFQPTRAEDHLDTLVLATRGYRGVFVPKLLAFGSGPETFEVYLRQQFAWARSMMQVLFGYTPRLIRRCGLRRAAQFLFAQTWYALWSVSMLTLFCMPLLALLTGREPAHAQLPLFVLAFAPMQLCTLTVWHWTRRWQVPDGVGLTWRGVVLHVARWPIVFWALLNVISRIRHPYMITPKGSGGIARFSLRVQALYLIGMALPMLVVWWYLTLNPIARLAGYAGFALQGAAFMLAVVVANAVTDLRNHHRAGLRASRVILQRVSPILVASAATLALVTTGFYAGNHFVERAVAANRSWADTTNALRTSTRPPVWGAYDPARTLDGLALGLDASYVNQSDADGLQNALDHADIAVPLVTIEPFSEDPTTSVLERTLDGLDDQQLTRLGGILRSANRPVLVRWGQEMDLPGLYPWSTDDPELYKAAYRHIVDVFRAAGASNVEWVWSPAGDAGSSAYYPGDDVVDLIGITVLGDPIWDWDLGFDRQSFAQLVAPRYAELGGLGKPMLIAELGVSGGLDEQQAWLDDALTVLPRFPLLRGIVYFNAPNAPNNHRETQPDWTLPRELMQDVVGAASVLEEPGGSREAVLAEN